VSETQTTSAAAVPLSRTVPAAPRPTIMYTFGRSLFRPLATVFLDLKWWGESNIPRSGGVIFACTHQSHLDPVLYGVTMQRRLSFFAKAELFENRAFGWVLRSVGAFPVRRGESDVAAFRQAIRVAKEGHALLVFPEGTRSPTGQIKELEPGIGLLARRAGVPVVPAVVDGSFRVLKKGNRWPNPQPVRILYGEPLEVSHLKPDAIVELVGQTLRQMLADLQSRS
jgi:1-acyl-sn-glycerol-3-phosphate acyltransferase